MGSEAGNVRLEGERDPGRKGQHHHHHQQQQPQQQQHPSAPPSERILQLKIPTLLLNDQNR